MLVQRGLAKYWRKSEEFRIQSSLQVEIKTSKTIALHSDIHKGVSLKKKFLSILIAVSIKDSHYKINLFAN